MGYKIFVVALLTFWLTGCEFINPPEPVPAYVRIDSLGVDQELSDHHITDVWINLDGVALGTFELPAIFPVIATGRQTLQIKAGIKNNGMVEGRKSYPFYKIYSVELDFVPEETIEIVPQFEYIENIDFVWSENFENAGLTLIQTDRSNAPLTLGQPAFEGNFCGELILTENQEIIEVKTTINFDLPRNGTPVFLEMNYKNNNEFIVGMFIQNINMTNQEPVIFLKPSENWNKIYIELTDFLSAYQSAIDFSIYIGFVRNAEVSEARVLIDNIKLIRYDET